MVDIGIVVRVVIRNLWIFLCCVPSVEAPVIPPTNNLLFQVWSKGKQVF